MPSSSFVCELSECFSSGFPQALKAFFISRILASRTPPHKFLDFTALSAGYFTFLAFRQFAERFCSHTYTSYFLATFKRPRFTPMKITLITHTIPCTRILRPISLTTQILASVVQRYYVISYILKGCGWR